MDARENNDTLKLKTIRVVQVKLPEVTKSTKSRRPTWAKSARRAMPISFYPEFSRLPGAMPGGGMPEVWVQATAEDGTWGLGKCGFGDPVAAFINTVIAPLLEGRNCMAIEHMNDLVLRVSQRFGPAGLAATAMSGVDLALWDLKGKLLRQPVYALLGGPVREKITCYATSDDLDWSRELGFTKFKITNPSHYSDGDAGLRVIEERVAHAREVVGPDVDLMINPVMAFNVEFALRLAERLKPYRLRWLEEPLPPADTEGLVQLRHSAPWLPIATGEDHRGRHAFLQLLDRRAVDILQPDIGWGGGLTEAMKVHVIGEAAGVATIPHGGANSPYGQHFAMAAVESPMAEFWLGTDPGIPLEEAGHMPGMALPLDGQVTPSSAPGFGIEIENSEITPCE